MAQIQVYNGHISSSNAFSLTHGITDVLTVSGSSIGINDTSPSYTLDVNGTGRFTNNVYLNNITYINTRGVLTWNTGYFRIQATSGNELRFGVNGGTNDMTLSTAGYLGIGKTTPAVHLDVSGSIKLQNALYFANSVGTNKWHVGYDNTNGGLNFVESLVADHRLFLKDGGLIGIGTSNPVYGRLQVNQIDDTDESGIGILNSSSARSMRLWTDAINSYINSGNGGAGILVLNEGGGYVGIGTTNPTAQLQVGPASTTDNSQNTTLQSWIYENEGGVKLSRFASNSFRLDTTFGGNLYLGANNATVMTIENGGNVGIGTTDPDQLLHVFAGSAGAVAAHSYSNLVVENNDYNAINILSPSTKGGWLMFGDESDAYVGGIYYNHVTDNMSLQVNDSTAQTLTSEGRIGIDIGTPLSKLHISGSIIESHSGSLLLVEGSSGSLFEVVDDLTDSLMSVNNITGLPVLEVFADNTVVLGAFNQNDLVVTGSQVGIGTSAPSRKFHVVEDTAANKIAVFQNSDTGNTQGIVVGTSPDGATSGKGLHLGYSESSDIAFLDAYDWDGSSYEEIRLNGGMFTMQSDGDVGIGTTSPAAKLNVYNSDTKAALTVTQNSTVNVGLYIDTVDYGFRVVSDDTDVSRYLISAQGNGGSTQAFYVGSNGYVGIGTTNPTTNFHIINTADTDNQIKIGSNGIYGAGISLDSTGTNGDEWRIISTGDSSTPGGGVLGFYNADTSTYRMILEAAGNVGIGITNPSDKLHVDGDIRVGNGYELVIMSGSADGGWHFKDDGNNTLQIRADSGIGGGFTFQTYDSAYYDRLTITHAGKIGIGTTAPGSVLDIFGTTTTGNRIGINPVDASFGWDFNNYINFIGQSGYNNIVLGHLSGSNYVGLYYGGFVTSGNIGIGTSDPQASLHVNGDAIFSGTVTAQEFHAEYVSSSIIYESGSTKFGDSLDDLHERTGSLEVSGSSHYILGNVGIGTTNPSTRLHVYGGDIYVIDNGGDPRLVLGDSTALGNWGSIKWDSTSNQLRLGTETGGVDTLVIDEAGKVGIGTTALVDYFTVNAEDTTADMRLSRGGSNPSTNATIGAIRFWQDYSATAENWGNILFGTNNSAARTSLQFQVKGPSGGVGTAMTLYGNDDGRFVGIGTTTPIGPLVVRGPGASGVGQIVIQQDAETTNEGPHIFFQTSTNNEGWIGFFSSSTWNNGNDLIINNYNSGGSIRLRTENSDSVAIDHDGYVGIGTTSPSSPLHISADEGDLLRLNRTNSGTGGWIQFTDNGTTRGYLGFGDSGNIVTGTDSDHLALRSENTLYFGSGGNNIAMTISGSNQYVGIGQTLPGNILHVRESSPLVEIESSTTQLDAGILLTNVNTEKWKIVKRASNHRLAFDDASSEVFTILQLGNVGIGTTNPSFALDIERTSGNVEIQLQARDNVSDTAIYFGDNDDSDVGRIVYDHSTNDLSFWTAAGERMTIDISGNISASGAFWMGDDLYVAGNIRAGGYKAFYIDNPETGGKLTHMALEGPEPDVYFRGESDKKEIKLPDYWKWLVDESTITVQITPKDFYQNLYYKRDGYNIYIKRKGWRNKLKYDFIVHGRRKDVDF